MRSRTRSCSGSAARCTTAASAARVEHLAEVACQAEPADVGAGVHADLGHGRGRRRVENGGLLDGRHHGRFVDDAVLERAGEHADAEPLGEHQPVAGPCAAVVHDLVRLGDAGHGQAVLGFLVVDGVPAGELRAGLEHLLHAAAEDLAQEAEVEVGRPGDEVHRRQRPGAHRVDVAERVRRGELPEPVRRVDHGREEVDRLHEAEVVADRHHRGVVARLQETRELTGGFGHAVEDGLQVARTQLGRSTALGRELRESDLVGHATSLPQAPGDDAPQTRCGGDSHPGQTADPASCSATISRTSL